MSIRPLSKKQMELLSFMRFYFARNDQLPSAEAIRDHFGWSSPNAAHCAREVLERKGWIERNEAGKYRFSRNREAA
jgi:SOS-response transcriptional repressor LexA